jgi:hypothetical protein
MLANVSDSGSNNFTLEREMHRQLSKQGLQSGHDFAWNPKKMAIRCFCHKMGLIVKAGLDALGMKPQRVQHSTLGRFPQLEVMAVIHEDDEQLQDAVEPQQVALDEGDVESEDGEDWESESNHSSDCSDRSDNQSNADPDEEDAKQEDEPGYYGHRKKAYLLGDTFMKKLTKDVRISYLLFCIFSFLFKVLMFPFCQDGFG